MKSKIILSVFLLIGLLVGCSNNQQFNRAIIKKADDTVIVVNVEKYRFYSGDTATIYTDNGEIYRVANTDVTLYVEEPQEQ